MQTEEIKININRKIYFYIIVLFTLYCFFLSWSFLFQNIDDAYISFRYGKNLMNGNGLVFNKGEYVEGYTNFLWTIITAPFTKINSIDISRFATILCYLISIFNIFLIVKVFKHLSDYFSELPWYIILFPVLFYICDDSIAFWSVAGMEFSLHIFIILGVAQFYFKINENNKSYLFLLIFLILGTLNRPEGNMVFLFTMFHMVIYRNHIENFSKKFSIIMISYLVFAVLYYGLKYFYYGSVIPNTFYAKGVTDVFINARIGLKYLILCMGSRIYVLFFILFIPFKKMLKDYKSSFLILFSLVYIFYLWYVGGDWMIANRLFTPIIPILYMLGAVGFSYAVKKFIAYEKNKNLNLNKICIYSAVFLSALIFIVTMSLLEYNTLITRNENRQLEMRWALFGKWLKENVSPNTVIAVGPAGKIPYYSDLYSIDMWGLNNEHIAKTKSKRLAAGHKKSDFDYVLSFNPEFLICYVGYTDEDVPPRYEKFNMPQESHTFMDDTFRLKREFRTNN